MQKPPFETVFDLSAVRGAFDAGKCFDAVWPWAAAGAASGALAGPKGALVGGLTGGGAAALTSPDCGDGRRSPATILRESISTLFPPSSPSSPSSSQSELPSLGSLGVP